MFYNFFKMIDIRGSVSHLSVDLRKGVRQNMSLIYHLVTFIPLIAFKLNERSWQFLYLLSSLR